MNVFTLRPATLRPPMPVLAGLSSSVPMRSMRKLSVVLTILPFLVAAAPSWAQRANAIHQRANPNRVTHAAPTPPAPRTVATPPAPTTAAKTTAPTTAATPTAPTTAPIQVQQFPSNPGNVQPGQQSLSTPPAPPPVPSVTTTPQSGPLSTVDQIPRFPGEQ
jgi:hypothetical protein